MIPGNANPLLLASAAADAAAAGPIKSLRFNNDDSPKLTRTPSTAGAGTKFTISFWAKLNSSDNQSFFSVHNDNGNTPRFIFQIVGSSDKADILAYDGSNSWNLITTRVFRDYSGWYHFVIAADTTDSTASNRIKFYVNGVQETTFDTETYPSQNFNCQIGSNSIVHQIGYYGSTYADCYLADFYLIEGSQLDPTSFGAYDDNGVWQAAAYSGTFGTNGFHLLDFASESTVGHDSSGNENDFTANNISTTAGVGNDVLFDVPVNGTQSDTGAGGEVSGNYAVMNALVKGSGTTLDNGNLDIAATGSAWNSVFGTIFVSSGKYYAEVTAIDVDSDYSTKRVGVGFARSTDDLISTASTYLGGDALSGAYFSNGNAFTNNTNNNVNSSFQTNDVIGVALDMDAGTVTFYKNNTVQSGTFTGLSGANCIAVSVHGSGGKASINFGQRAWAYSAPSNHKPLCTALLPTPTIADGSDYFDTVLYTGNGATGSRSITGLSFAPDFSWFKGRSYSISHLLYDSVRGAGSTKSLVSNGTNSEGSAGDNSTFGYLESFDSSGFSIFGGSDVNNGYINKNSATYASWHWDAGSSTASNTDGSITSSVRASQTSGFSVVTFTGTGANATVGHGLNAEPYLLLTKCRESGFNWAVYHKSKGNTGRYMLNNTLAFATSSTFWNDTTPTSSVFSVGSFFASGNTFVAYCIAPVAGYSAVGEYSGGSSPFVYTGFRPRFLLARGNSSGRIWNIYDSARDEINVMTKILKAEDSGAEVDTSARVDFLSNGFKVRASSGAEPNTSETFYYYAVAENPFQANGGLAR